MNPVVKARIFLALLAGAYLWAAALLLGGCGEGWKAREGWEQSGAGEPPGAAEVFQAAHDLAPCSIEPWGGWVTWHDGPFDCGGVLAAGCFTGGPTGEARLDVVGLPWFGTAQRSGLPHELGHYVLARCQGDWSEAGADAFAEAVRERIRLQGLRAARHAE